VATYGDGWYGFNLAKDEVPGRMATLASRCRLVGRDPATVEVAVSLRDGSPEDVVALADAGVTELVVVDSPPADPVQADQWVTALARRWDVAASPG